MDQIFSWIVFETQKGHHYEYINENINKHKNIVNAFFRDLLALFYPI